ncbi:dihydroorotate dehydrogenase (fumarate) [Caloramator quimbayensis]|uniref:dihydrouracil dehydrogenase (NAD(+)) n=1 Tax=Caloramator quimbayensis TaxID=1147123 RepID=A0A1T4Y8Y3_9CLOT|nr:4Fe-4S binding protein [Caloramator quimbayensis]SKA97741.1 dihydroorotate dehydrogenase (fumarate) [Caloramator quimbayensis]
MDLSTRIAGINLKNPIMPASGPLVSTYEKMMAISGMGVGCMVAKTISIKGADVPRPCIIGNSDSIMNCELWSEYPLGYWIENILPKLKDYIDIPLILSAGYTKEDMKVIIPELDKYADAFEISTHYVGKDVSVIGETVKTIKSLTDKPVFMKISPHIPDVVEFAKVVRENGAAGIVAINSLGPAMKIDLKNRKVLVGNEKGEVWVSGPAIKPVALAIISRIKTAMPDFTVIGVGGIQSAEDVLEFLLCGADAVQILSSAMLKGRELYKKIIDDLPAVLEKYNFKSVKDAINTPLLKPEIKFNPNNPVINKDKCILCGLCAKICPYFALTVDKEVIVNRDKCFGCGLCQSKCPSKAINGVF